MNPSLSILTPSKNYATFIRDALLSVHLQKSRSVEHVVVDGGSSDGTRDILQKFEGEITWISEPDMGQSDALNKAFKMCRGDWIGWLNADEFYLPGALDYVLEQISNDPKVDCFFGDSIFVDEEGHFKRLMAHHPFKRGVLRNYGCFINSCSAFFRSDLLVDSKWDVSLSRVMDWDLWLTFEERNVRFQHLAQPLGAYRIHARQQTSEVASPTSTENVSVRTRHHLPTTKRAIRNKSRVGRIERIALKALSGGYLRQVKARRVLKGSNLRWFIHSSETENATALISVVAKGYSSPK